MKRTVIVFYALISAFSCFASDSTDSGRLFKIADYHPPRFRTQSLELQPSLDMYTNGHQDSSLTYNSISETRSSYGSADISCSHGLRAYTEMGDLELSNSASLNAGTNSSTGINSRDLFSQSINSPSISYLLSNNTRYRRYLPLGLFLEGGLFPTLFHSPYEKNEEKRYGINDYGYDTANTRLAYYYSRINKYTQSWMSLKSGFNVSIGKGWVADVTGAAVALQMVDRIAAIKGSRPSLSGAQITSLSSMLDRLRWKRIFDSRIANIEAIDTLCQYLVAEKVLPGETARMAMELNDIRNYGFYQPRYSGKEIKITPMAFVYYDQRDYHYTTNNTDSIGPYNPATRPADLASWPLLSSSQDRNIYSKLYLSYGLSAYAGFSRLFGRDVEADGKLELAGTMNTLSDSLYSSTSSGANVKETYPNARVKINADITWYPSLRSTIAFTNQLLYSRDFNLKSQVIHNASYIPFMDLSPGTLTYLQYTSGLKAHYYISPRCAYSVWASARFGRGKNRAPNDSYYFTAYQRNIQDWDFSIGTDLTYAIF
jgi:hypothetical protein